MSFTLTELEAVFEALGPVGQIQLIDHLSRRMDCSDGIDAKACAEQHADNECRWDATDSEREAVVEEVLYPLVTEYGVKPIMNHATAIAERVRRDIDAIQNPSRWAVRSAAA